MAGLSVSGKRLIVVPKYEYTYWWDRFEAYYSPFFDRIEAMPSIKPEGPQRYWRRHHGKVTKRLDEWLRAYDIVVLVDPDEFIIPNSDKYRDLGDYLDRWHGDIIRTYGYGVMEMPDDEPLDHSKPILEQRKYWYRDHWYDKPIITRVMTKYAYGFHDCDMQAEPDPDLVMFHLRDADFINLDKHCPYRNPRLFDAPNVMNYEQRLEICEPIPDKWMGLL
jgi:hypothetical protein